MRTLPAAIIAATLALAAVTGCRQAREPAVEEPALPLEGIRVLIVVPPKDFRRTIYDAVTGALQQAGATFDLCSTEPGSAVGNQGRSIQVDLTPDGVEPRQYEAVVFVGGPGMRALADDPDLVDLAQGFHQAGKVIGAIRFSAAILANADLLDGKTVTAGDEIKSTLQSKGAVVTSAPVEVDGSIVTGHGPEAAQAFADALVEVLAQRAPAAQRGGEATESAD
jgi:protease I